MIYNILGRDPNCFTGGDCWSYDYSNRWLLILGITISIIIIARIADRWLLLLGITISIIVIARIAKNMSNKRRGTNDGIQ